MMKSTLWTQRRFTGIALILGCVLFLSGTFLHHLLPIVMGILLLLRRYQVPGGSQQQEGSIVAATTAVE